VVVERAVGEAGALGDVGDRGAGVAVGGDAFREKGASFRDISKYFFRKMTERRN
jgi:hypothetical protein